MPGADRRSRARSACHDDWVEHDRGDAGTRAVFDLETSWGSERLEVRRASPDDSWLEEP